MTNKKCDCCEGTGLIQYTENGFEFACGNCTRGINLNRNGLPYRDQEPEGYYLHKDDNYYWTPEAWAEYQRLKAENAELRLNQPFAGSTDTLTEKYRLRERLTKERTKSKALCGALEGLTNAALANLKPLPSQVEAAFEALAKYGKEN